MLELTASVVVPYLPLCVRALSQICVACVNRNKFEHVRIFASPLQPSLRPLRPPRHLSPTIRFLCAKIDSVQTQWTQDKKLQIYTFLSTCTTHKNHSTVSVYVYIPSSDTKFHPHTLFNFQS